MNEHFWLNCPSHSATRLLFRKQTRDSTGINIPHKLYRRGALVLAIATKGRLQSDVAYAGLDHTAKKPKAQHSKSPNDLPSRMSGRLLKDWVRRDSDISTARAFPTGQLKRQANEQHASAVIGAFPRNASFKLRHAFTPCPRIHNTNRDGTRECYTLGKNARMENRLLACSQVAAQTPSFPAKTS
jgi:hypothetical protein